MEFQEKGKFSLGKNSSTSSWINSIDMGWERFLASPSPFTLWHYWDSIRTRVYALAWLGQRGWEYMEIGLSELLSSCKSGHSLASKMCCQNMKNTLQFLNKTKNSFLIHLSWYLSTAQGFMVWFLKPWKWLYLELKKKKKKGMNVKTKKKKIKIKSNKTVIF